MISSDRNDFLSGPLDIKDWTLVLEIQDFAYIKEKVLNQSIKKNGLTLNLIINNILDIRNITWLYIHIIA